MSTDEAIKRAVCEALGGTYRADVDAWISDRDTVSWEQPRGNHGDAITALEVWRARHGGWWMMDSPCSDSLESEWRFTITIGNMHAAGAALDMPAAACKAIAAAWAKMKETSNG